MTELLLAIDLGTSSTKLLAVDRSGKVVARSRIAHVTHRPSPDAAEQDPAEWWNNLLVAISNLTLTIGGGHVIAAIGVTGQMHGLVIHNEDESNRQPAIIWQDHRSATTLPGLQGKLDASSARRLSPGFQAASWHWLMHYRPEHTARATRILLPKDEIVWRLTGEHVTDPSDAIGTGWFDPASGTWDDSVLDAANSALRLLPRIVPSGSLAGLLTPAAASALGLSAGIPVVIAGGDAAVGTFGAGSTEAAPLLMLSTGCQVLQPICERPTDNVWPSANPEGLPRWLRVAATLNGGNVVNWARETFGEPAGRQGSDLVFLPYLDGERSPHIGDDAAGAFLGLRAHHDRAAMSRAVVDGVSLAIVDAFEYIGGEVGSDAPILVGGGGIRHHDWLDSIAAVFARPLEVITEPDLSAWGAARSTASALGWIDPIIEPETWRPPRRHVPAPVQDIESVLTQLTRFRDLSRHVYGDMA